MHADGTSVQLAPAARSTNCDCWMIHIYDQLTEESSVLCRKGLRGTDIFLRILKVPSRCSAVVSVPQ